jgi:ATP-dependent helicase/nuclease subunit A
LSRLCLERLDDGGFWLPTLIASTTGVRRGEALGLAWGAVNWNEATIRISQQIVKDPKTRALDVNPLKTENGRRTITITSNLVEALLDHCQRHLGIGDDVLIMSRRDQSPMMPDSFTWWFRTQLRPMLGDGDWFTPHCLRRTHATQLDELGVRPKDIHARLGHSDPMTTARYRAAPLPHTAGYRARSDVAGKAITPDAVRSEWSVGF